METYDCVVIGGGPAGLSAAIYLARYHRSVMVLDHGDGRSTTHEINENYFGFPEGIPSKELRTLGKQQAERFGAQFTDCKIEEMSCEDGDYRAIGERHEFHGRTVILAMGVKDKLPEFDNKDAKDYFGKSLFWCITCDGHKVQGARVAIVGADDEAATTCLQFLNFTDKLTVITNRPGGEAEFSDKKRKQLADAGIPLLEGTIGPLRGSNGMMTAVELDDGRGIELDFMFNQQGARPNSMLAKSLGVATNDDGYIKVDNEARTNVERVYAAGDVTRQFAHQVVTAAHEGATAAQAANYDLYRPEQKEE